MFIFLFFWLWWLGRLRKNTFLFYFCFYFHFFFWLGWLRRLRKNTLLSYFYFHFYLFFIFWLRWLRRLRKNTFLFIICEWFCTLGRFFICPIFLFACYFICPPWAGWSSFGTHRSWSDRLDPDQVSRKSLCDKAMSMISICQRIWTIWMPTNKARFKRLRVWYEL